MKNESSYAKEESSEVEQGKDLLNATAEATENAVVEARNRLKAALQAAGETYNVAKAKTIQGAKATDKLIRENPYQALGIAFGIGALLGFLLSRRSRD